MNFVWLLISVTLLCLSPVPASATETAGASATHLCRTLLAGRVDDVVSGLYESIPGAHTFGASGFTFETKRLPGSDFSWWAHEFTTTIRDGNGNAVGVVERWVSRDRKKMSFQKAQTKFLDDSLELLPSVIHHEGSIPLIAGRGTPLQAFTTLNIMRLAGIEYGGLERAYTSGIDNIKTSLELVRDPAIRTWMTTYPGEPVPAKLIAAAIPNTSTGRYMQAVLTQSGHAITKIVVSVQQLSMRALEKFFEPNPSGRTYSKTNREIAPLLVNLEPSTLLPTGFSIEFELERRRQD